MIGRAVSELEEIVGDLKTLTGQRDDLRRQLAEVEVVIKEKTALRNLAVRDLSAQEVLPQKTLAQICEKSREWVRQISRV